MQVRRRKANLKNGGTPNAYSVALNNHRTIGPQTFTPANFRFTLHIHRLAPNSDSVSSSARPGTIQVPQQLVPRRSEGGNVIPRAQSLPKHRASLPARTVSKVLRPITIA